VRIALVENEQRMQSALHNITRFLRGEVDSSNQTVSSEIVV